MSNTRRAKNPDAVALIKGAKRPEKIVPICLRPDLNAEIDRLEGELGRQRPSERLIGNAENVRIAKQIEAVREQMRQSTVEFHFRALGRKEFREFTANHAPRDGDADDQRQGINRETYAFDLVRMCLVSPTLDDETYATLVDDTLSAGQWGQMADAAIGLNIQDAKVPYSSNASLILSSSAETSKRPPVGGSPSNGSTGGSQSKSPSTSTTKMES